MVRSHRSLSPILPILLAFPALVGCGGDRAAHEAAGTVRIAVASNFVEPLEELAARFRSMTGFRTVISSASTGALYAQIRNGAPFDVFLAADSARPAQLESDGYVVSGTRFTYAVGRLVLFSPAIADVASGPEVLLDVASYTWCAMANPRTAPYGHATRQALENLRIFDAVHDRTVKGANIAQTFQIVDAGGAELGFVARSQVVKRAEGYRWLVPAELHDPLRQDAVLLKAEQPNGAASAFLAFLGGGEARRIIRAWGYDDPEGASEAGAVAADEGFDWRPIWLTLQLATITTLVLLLLGTPLAWWLARTKSRFRHAVGAVTALPLVMPPTVLGFYLLVLLGPNSPIGGFWEWTGGGRLVFSFTGLVIGSVIYSMPFVVKPLHDAFEAIGNRPLEVAATLGASPRDRFFTVAVPIARPGFLTAATLGFAHTVGEFGVVLMIGGNVPGSTQVVSIAIFEHVESLNYAQAHVLSAGMLVFSFLMLLTVYAVNNRRIAAPL